MADTVNAGAPIVVVTGLPGSAADDDRVRAVDPRVRLARASGGEDLARLLPEAHVFHGSDLTADQLALARALRWIHNPGVGVDGLPWESLPARDVVVTNGLGGHEVIMAETVMAGLLMFARRIHVAHRNQVLRGAWHRPPAIGGSLAGSTVALLGVGGIGRAVAQRLRPFGARILGVRRTAASVADVEEVTDGAGLEGVLRAADFIVVTLPLTPRTRGLLGARELAWMKPTAVLVNVGRGEVIDETALAAALRRGRVGGALLDVFETEPLPADSPLWGLENVVITPHVAGAGPDRARNSLQVFCDNLRRFAAGEPLRYIVPAARGY
jgi:phosphoglycerate dehydrogenase-like enzyme